MTKTRGMELLDALTIGGDDALGEAAVDDAITFWQALEPLRSPDADQRRRRLNVGVSYGEFMRKFIDNSRGTPLILPNGKQFGPVLLLLYQAHLISHDQLDDVWKALDAVRAKRDERRATKVAKPEHVSA